ncbi:MAG TPA: alpha/beta hydrolase [Acidimicrobiales bacterium]|nr:alpha/beta hydrolase [Acidimicrobiales bacterium]
MTAPVEHLTLTASGLSFDALALGPPDGELVLLLHGFPQTARAWTPLLAPLAAAGYRAVAVTQRGYSPGARPEGDEAYAMDDLVGDVLNLAEALGAEAFHLVGHDWGGAVAWQVAGTHHTRVRTLTVLSTPHPSAFRRALAGELGGDQAERSGYMALFAAEGTAELLAADGAAGLRGLYEASGLPAEEVGPYVEALGSVEVLDAALAWYRAARDRLTGDFVDIEVPTLYLWGVDDLALGREAAEATGDHVTGPYRFVPLDGVGHWVVEAAPGPVADALLAHLGAAG